MFKNIIELIEKLKEEQDCINLLKLIRWNNKITCPFVECSSQDFAESYKIYSFKDGKRFQCSCCNKIFSYKTGTMFENSKIPLKKWFMAIYLHTAHKKGISSCQLARDISVTQKSAWFMLQRIREIADNFNNDKFDGITEMDETYYGGKFENKHMHERIALKEKDNKAVVFGMLNRDTKQIKTVKVESAEYHNLAKEVMENVKEGSTLITDGHASYIRLNRFYEHKSVNHSADEFVRNEKNPNREAFKIHTNGIEGYWSWLKRGIDGIYHWVSKKHLERYLKEFEFRYNTREMKDFERFNHFLTKIKGRLTYANLIK